MLWVIYGYWAWGASQLLVLDVVDAISGPGWHNNRSEMDSIIA